MTPITAEPLQSGAHIAERICCRRIESPLSKRWSVWASEVRIATFCLHDHVHDRPRVRRRAVRGLALLRLEARVREGQAPVGLFEQKVAAVGRKELEDQVHDLVEHGREVVGRDEGLRDLDEDLEDAILVRDVQLRPPPLRGRVGKRHRALLEPEVLVQLGDRADAGRGRVDDALALPGRRRIVAEAQQEGADQRAVAVVHVRMRHGLVVHLHPVGRLVVVEDPAAVLLLEVGMPARDGEVVQDDVVVVRAADERDFLRQAEDLRPPLGFVQDLEHEVRKL